MRFSRHGIATLVVVALHVAGCDKSIQLPDASDDAGTRNSNIDGASPVSTDASRPTQDSARDSGTGLTPYSLDDFGCKVVDGATCCTSVRCFVIDGKCPDADAPDSPLGPFPGGIMDCHTHGPVGPNPDDPRGLVGNCCYVYVEDIYAAQPSP